MQNSIVFRSRWPVQVPMLDAHCTLCYHMGCVCPCCSVMFRMHKWFANELLPICDFGMLDWTVMLFAPGYICIPPRNISNH